MEEIIDEIAQLLDSDERVFLHRQTHEILNYPDPTRQEVWELDYIIEEVDQKVFNDPDQYIQFDPPTSKEAYKLMEEFADAVLVERSRLRLFDALASKKPFRYFKDALISIELEEEWYDFRFLKMKERVMSHLEQSFLSESE
jgi:hypothetical protein